MRTLANSPSSNAIRVFAQQLLAPATQGPARHDFRSCEPRQGSMGMKTILSRNEYDLLLISDRHDPQQLVAGAGNVWFAGTSAFGGTGQPDRRLFLSAEAFPFADEFLRETVGNPAQESAKLPKCPSSEEVQRSTATSPQLSVEFLQDVVVTRCVQAMGCQQVPDPVPRGAVHDRAELLPRYGILGPTTVDQFNQA